MQTRIVLANDGVAIDFPAILNFLNSACSHLTFEPFQGKLHIAGDTILPDTAENLKIKLEDDILFLMIYTDKQYYNNYFYEEYKNIIITSFYGWEYLTSLPKNNGAPFFVMEVMSELLDPSFRHTLDDDSKPECIYDFLVDKTGIDSSMRASCVCPKCNNRIKLKINKSSDIRGVFEDFKIVLNHIGNASKWDDDFVQYWLNKARPHNSNKYKKNLFISYSHVDSSWLNRVKIHLKPLERNAVIEIWEDTRIKTGDNWKEEISTALKDAHAAILLVSADFLASDFIVENELPPLLKKAESEGTRIFPVLISPSCFEETPELSKFQAVNSPSKTLVEVNQGEQERFLLTLAKEIISHVKN